MDAIFDLGGPIILLRTVQETVLEGEPSTFHVRCLLLYGVPAMWLASAKTNP